MIKRFKALLLSSMTAIMLLVPAIAMPALAHADSINQGLNCGSQLQFSDKACSNTGPDAQNSVNNIIKLVINIFSIVVGLIAVIMIIIGGIRFVLSGGDSANVTSARNTILYAIVGLVIVALAQILVRYVLNRVNSSVS